MLDIMLDLETMGTSAQAAIISIGAIEFDLASGEIGDPFYSVIDLESAMKAGGVIDASTILWWMQQSNEARQAFSRPGDNIELVLGAFSRWLAPRGHAALRMWGNGAAFDNAILASAYQRLNLPVPWKFYNDRCYRTIKGLYPHIEMAREGTHHNALDDAKSQARHLIAMLRTVS